MAFEPVPKAGRAIQAGRVSLFWLHDRHLLKTVVQIIFPLFKVKVSEEARSPVSLFSA